MSNSNNFEFVRAYNQDWADACVLALNYLYIDNPSCVGKVRAIVQDLVNKVIEIENLSPPKKPKGNFHNVFNITEVKTALDSAHEYVSKMNTNGRLVHELNCSHQVAKEALEYLFKAFLWFFEKYKILDTSLTSLFVLHDSPEELRQIGLVINSAEGELQNTRTNGHALFEGLTKLQQPDQELLIDIMAQVEAFAPIQEKTIASFIPEKNTGIKHNLETLLTGKILKKAGNTLLVNTASEEAKRMCKDAFNLRLDEIIALLENK